jgi:hypothetical protein
MRMPFGKYAGLYVSELPTGYLAWLLDNVELRWLLRQSVAEELNRRVAQDRQAPPAAAPEAPRLDLENTVASWFRRLALKWHPDRGGSDVAIQVVNDAHEMIREALGIGTDGPAPAQAGGRRC